LERFITSDLPKAVAHELDRGSLADQSQAAGELQALPRRLGKRWAWKPSMQMGSG